MGSGSSSEPQIDHAISLHTKSGPVTGHIFIKDGKEYVAFFLIEYGESPLGPRRFKKPVPKAPWTEIGAARLGFGPECPRYRYEWLNTELQEEMCLNLNIIAPKQTNEMLPVFVWINSSDTNFHVDFKAAYEKMELAELFFTKGVIFVSINFRSGVVGFFTTGDDVCPGNLGMWDIQLALLWIKENIGVFGGDANNVTLCGQNSGGSIVDLLSLSPHTRDLFHKCILMSGTAEGPLFTVRDKAAQVEISKEVAGNMGWKGEDSDSEALWEHMWKTSAENMFSWKACNLETQQCHPFLPVFDGDFFPEPLSVLRANAPKKDVLVGILSCDGQKLNWELDTKVPYTGFEMDLLINEGNYGEEFKAVRSDVIQFYNGNIDMSNKKSMNSKHEQFLSDCVITNGTLKYAQTMSELGHNVYLFNIDGPDKNRTQLVESVATHFTVFAKSGNPNKAVTQTSWEKFSSANRFRYYNIHSEFSEMKYDFGGRRIEFWEKDIYPRKI